LQMISEKSSTLRALGTEGPLFKVADFSEISAQHVEPQ